MSPELTEHMRYIKLLPEHRVGIALETGGEQLVPFLGWRRLDDGTLWLILDNRFGLDLPRIADEKADEIVEFIANAIAVGGGYPSIYYLDRKMPFRG